MGLGIGFDEEAIYAALFALWKDAYSWKQAPSRRLRLWTSVPLDARPAAYQFEGDDQTFDWPNAVNPRVTLRATLIAYFNADDGNPGATTQNAIIKAIREKIQPAVGVPTGTQTLGGLVQWCRIQGIITRVPGDIDNEGMIMIPVVMQIGN